MNNKKNYYIANGGKKVLKSRNLLKKAPRSSIIYLGYTKSEIEQFELKKIDKRFRDFKLNSPMTRIGCMTHENW